MKVKALIGALLLSAPVTMNAAAADSVAAIEEEVVEIPLTAAQTDSLSRAAATVMAEVVTRSLGNLDKMGLPVDRKVFAEEFGRLIGGGKGIFEPAQANEYIGTLDALVNPRLPDTVSVASQKEFVSKAAALPGATTTSDGLVFIIEQEGEGPMPVDGDMVTVNYTGRLSDGTVFDDTKGTPVQFNVNRLIPGFTEGLKLMKPGGTYRLVIPSELAYGADGIEGVIPGNSALDFTVTLNGITPAGPESPAAQPQK